jgi:predicted GIY-YIG superfamily endonuclease
MTTVYKLFDADGQWLYVGITDSLTTRLVQHGSKPWFIHVTRATFEHYETREEASERERELIRVHQPRHNIIHRAGPHVAKSICLTDELAAQVTAAAREEGHGNASRIVVQAITEYLARKAEEAA